MARTKETEKNVTFEPVKQTVVDVELIGTSDLILNKKCRSYERAEVWKQTNPKGAKMPKNLEQDYNLWEHLSPLSPGTSRLSSTMMIIPFTRKKSGSST